MFTLEQVTMMLQSLIKLFGLIILRAHFFQNCQGRALRARFNLNSWKKCDTIKRPQKRYERMFYV